MAEEQPTIPTQTPNPYVNAKGKPNARSRAGMGEDRNAFGPQRPGLGLGQVVQDITTAGLPKLNVEKKPSVGQEVVKAGLQRRFLVRGMVAPKTISNELYGAAVDQAERQGRQEKLNQLNPTPKTPEEKQLDAEAAQAHHETLMSRNTRSMYRRQRYGIGASSLVGTSKLYVPTSGGQTAPDGNRTQYERLVSAGQIKPLSAEEMSGLPSAQEVERNRQAGEENRVRMENMTTGGGDGDWSKSKSHRASFIGPRPAPATESEMQALRDRAAVRIQGAKDEAKAARAAKKAAAAPAAAVTTPAAAEEKRRSKVTGTTTKAAIKEAVAPIKIPNSKKR